MWACHLETVVVVRVDRGGCTMHGECAYQWPLLGIDYTMWHLYTDRVCVDCVCLEEFYPAVRVCFSFPCFGSVCCRGIFNLTVWAVLHCTLTSSLYNFSLGLNFWWQCCLICLFSHVGYHCLYISMRIQNSPEYVFLCTRRFLSGKTRRSFMCTSVNDEC